MFGSKRRQTEIQETLLQALDNLYRTLGSKPNIVITQEIDLRPCYVNGRRALFHRWANSARPQLPKGQEPGENARYFQFRSTHGLVEYEDGTCDLVWPYAIKFADGGHFKDYAWNPVDRQEGDNESR